MTRPIAVERLAAALWKQAAYADPQAQVPWLGWAVVNEDAKAYWRGVATTVSAYYDALTTPDKDTDKWRQMLADAMNRVRARYWQYGAGTKCGRVADAILGDIIEAFGDKAVTLSTRLFFASTDPSVNPVARALLTDTDKEARP